MMRSSPGPRCITLRWDGTLQDLPGGIDGAIARGFDEGGANVLCALVIMVPGRVGSSPDGMTRAGRRGPGRGEIGRQFTR
jgi:hypothetical protein